MSEKRARDNTLPELPPGGLAEQLRCVAKGDTAPRTAHAVATPANLTSALEEASKLDGPSLCFAVVAAAEDQLPGLGLDSLDADDVLCRAASVPLLLCEPSTVRSVTGRDFPDPHLLLFATGAVAPECGLELSAVCGVTLISVKRVSAPVDVLFGVAVRPAFSLAHLLDVVSERCARGAWTVLYFGALWCPPCRNILPHMPGMQRSLRPAVDVAFLKIDRDLCEAVHDVLGVEIIPTFKIVAPAGARPTKSEVAAFHNADGAEEEDRPQVLESLPAVQDSLQNSQPATVSTFIEKNVVPLSFGDDDF